jgi:short-subunit dehydrogenase
LLSAFPNNAGYGYMAGVEEGEDDEVRALFETNFFGLVNVTRAVLPGMRKRRSGNIVNISSMGGFVGQASSGYYNATKFAVEGLSEALAKEVEPLGIKVMIVEPGAFRTDWAGRSLRLTHHSIDDYANTAGVRRQTVTGRSGKQPGDPVRGAKAIIEAVQSGKPPQRLLLGRMALDTARGKLEALRGDFEGWEQTTLSADFPVKQ